VSTDYLMGLTENKNYPNTELQSLHLSDDMVELLSSGTEMLIHEFCDKLQIPFEKISSEDFSAFLRILSLSKQLKSPNKEKLLKPDFGQKKEACASQNVFKDVSEQPMRNLWRMGRALPSPASHVSAR
jgi:hypothetical protein